jgi:phytoene synthase
MCAVYAFMRRADDLADDESIPLEERRRLMAEWNASWQRGGHVHDADAKVFLAVRDVQQRFGVSDNLLNQLVRGTTMDLDPDPSEGVRRMSVRGHSVDQYETLAALERYCYLVASVVGLVTIRIFGCTDTATADPYAEQLGLAFQVTNILRDVREDAERGRIYLPEALLQQHGLGAEEIFAAVEAGAPSAALRQMLADLAARAERWYQAEHPLIPLLAPDSRAAMRVLIEIYHLLLRRIVAVDYSVFSDRVSVSTPKKLGVLVRGLVEAKLLTRARS